jgi:hypothetical protein
VGLGGLDHPRVEGEPVDEDGAPRQLEGPDAQPETPVDLVDGPVHPPSKEPACAGDERPVE